MTARKPGPGSALAGTFDKALAFHRQGKLTEAERLYRAVLSKRPDHPGLLYHLGLVRTDQGQLEDGAALFRRSLELDPTSADAHNALGTVLQRLERADEAIVEYRAALALKPGDANAHANLGAALATLGREDEALAAYDRALAVDPRHSGALANVGNALKALGRLDEARAAYERAIAAAPRQAQLYFALADCRRFAADDPFLDAMEQLTRTVGAMPLRDQIHLHFALGKAYADHGAHDKAFDHLLKGNALKRGSISYDEAGTLGWFERMRAVFTPALMRARAGQGDRDAAPIFVVGMPRSGTTLVEQILAAHPRVFGAGEIESFGQAVSALADAGGGARYPELTLALDGAGLARLGATYVAAIRALAPDAARVTDKLPLNFAYVGLIHLALPNARIIHVRRDPVDTCWSCFSKLFTRSNQFTYDLGEIGRFYRGYEAVMAHWRAVLPDGVMLELRYEDVTADLEAQARRIVAHGGLEWDDVCLAFHAARRAVRTASAAQVRRPIYGEAVGRAAPYRHRLTPLLAALGG